MIMQYKEKLESEGFSISVEKKFNTKCGIIQADLYAEKGQDKRIYEFKYYGNKRYNKGTVISIKKYAESIGAKFFMVYLTPYRERKIEFDDLGEILTSFMINDILPNELDCLSTHTTIEEVTVDSINNIYITDHIRVTGDAIISIELQFGSDSDYRHEIGLRTNESFPMTFDVKLDRDLNIVSCDVEIDTDDYYE